MAVALAECCIVDRERPTGADVDLSGWESLPITALLFGEGQGRIIVSTTDSAAVLRVARERRVPARVIGTTRPRSTELRISVGSVHVHAPVSRLAEVYFGAIPRIMVGSAAVLQSAEEPSPAELFV